MSEEGGLARTLQEITDVTMPAPRYAKYHERHLQRHLSLLGNYPPRCCLPASRPLIASRLALCGEGRWQIAQFR
jgi:hypothetical protein